jgi:predicted HTH domain antitoxin
LETLLMSISFTLPATIEEKLRAELGNLDEAAKEAALVELYRQEKLSHGLLAECLGISRDEVNAVLKRHNVNEDLPTIPEFDDQMKQLRNLLDK